MYLDVFRGKFSSLFLNELLNPSLILFRQTCIVPILNDFYGTIHKLMFSLISRVNVNSSGISKPIDCKDLKNISEKKSRHYLRYFSPVGLDSISIISCFLDMVRMNNERNASETAVD